MVAGIMSQLTPEQGKSSAQQPAVTRYPQMGFSKTLANGARHQTTVT